jgi:hypothetical protein
MLCSHMRFRLKIDVRPGELRVRLHYGVFAIMDSDRRRERKAAPKRRNRRPANFLFQRRLVRLAPDLIRAAMRGLQFVLKHTRFDNCTVEGVLRTDDPAHTGILFGLLCTLTELIGIWFSKLRVAVVPDFGDKEAMLSVQVEGSLRAAVLLALPVVILFHLPKVATTQLLIVGLRR